MSEDPGRYADRPPAQGAGGNGQAAQVFSFGQTGYAPGLQFIGALVKAGEPMEPVRDALIATVEGFAQTPPTVEEMERARRNFANGIEKSLNDPQKVGVSLSRGDRAGRLAPAVRGPRQAAEHHAGSRWAAAAGRYLTRDNRVVGSFVPEDAPLRAEIPAAPSVAEVMKDFKGQGQCADVGSVRPEPGQHQRPHRDQGTIAGLKVALLTKKNRGEAVSVDMQLHWGDEKNLFNTAIVSTAANEMLMRGAPGKYSREQLAGRLRQAEDLRQPVSLRHHRPEPGRRAALGRPCAEGRQLPGGGIRAAAPAMAGGHRSVAQRAAIAGAYGGRPVLQPLSERRRARADDGGRAAGRRQGAEAGRRRRLPPRLLRRQPWRAGHRRRFRQGRDRQGPSRRASPAGTARWRTRR